MPGKSIKPVKGKLYQLALSDLAPDTTQPRRFFDEQALLELKWSIEKHGMLQPILVRSGENGGFLVVSGERRYQASLLAGLSTVPALFTDGDPAEISIVENLLRENLTAIEEAEAIDRLKCDHDYQLGDLSAVLGKSISTLSEILSLTRLPETVKDDCRNDRKTSRAILIEIAKQRSPEKMGAMYTRYRESGLTRGELKRRPRLTRLAPGPPDFTFIGNCAERIDALDLEGLEAIQIAALATELVKMQLAVRHKMKLVG
jgi:ParB family transcriptional regulator, chromosome partitioning protein